MAATAPVELPDLSNLTPVERLQLDRLLLGIAPTFRNWNERVSPEMRWDWPHLVALQHEVDRLMAGDGDRLLVEIPVRHGKTECVTVRAPAMCLVQDPTFRVIIGGYNATLADRFSRKCRAVAMRAGVKVSDEKNTAEEWDTTEGGGVIARGVGTGVTGFGGDGIFVDDPIKNREEAESAVYREKLWDWFTSDLTTRCEPGGFMVVSMSRWHEDDIIGRILASEDAGRWRRLRLPALAEPNDPLGREEGEALCPDRYTADDLEATRLSIGDYPFAGLYQQEPVPRKAGMFPPSSAVIVDAAPAGLQWLRWWDRASGEGKSDQTAGAKVAVRDGVIYVGDITAGRWQSDKRDRVIRQTAELDGRTVPQWGEQEPGSSGKDMALAFVRLLGGFPAYTQPTTGDKVSAMDPLAAQWKAGNVRLVRPSPGNNGWIPAFLDEAKAAPFGRYDDQIESVCRAYNKLMTQPRRPRVGGAAA